MTIPLLADFGQEIIKLLLGVVAVFLILLVLVQRGRGGGLAGALGGMGGSSAFGAKAGDVFTKITVGAAAFWIFLCIVAVKLGPSEESRINTGGGQESSAPVDPPALSSAEETDQAEAEEGSAEAATGEAATEETPPENSDAAGEDTTSSEETPQE